MSETRRLAAILVADVVGYSRMMGEDEAATLRALRSLWADVVEPSAERNKGRVFKSVGDGKLIEFSSAVDAVRCALDIQERRTLVEPPLRIGVHVGDVVIEDGDLLGDSVNIAARLQQEAPANGILVSGAVYDQLRGKLGISLSDLGELKLKNVRTPVRAWKWTAGGAGSMSATGADQSSTPSLALIPFVNIGNDPEQEYFADGLVEDMITTLAKLSGLTVIAPNSTFLFKDRKADARETARALGVQFILEGSVRRSGDRVRITVQLVDGKSGASLWAERYDRAVEDLFALQDEITLIVATELQVKLTEGEQARLRYTTTQNVEAWTLWAQGLAHYRTGVMTPEGSGRARQFWERALECDPNSSNLHGMLATLRVADARLGWWGTREDAITIGMEHARKALDLDPNNADAHLAAGMLLYLQRRFDEAENAARLALELAPGAADVAALAATVLAAGGAYDEALSAIERAMRLSPKPPANYFGIQGNVLRLAGKDIEATAAFQTLSRRNPGFGHLDLAIIYYKQGRAEEARAEVTEALKARPRLSVTSFAITQVRRNDEALAADLEALRASGLPE
ncbi:MAG: hypothetical protein KF779_16935 [Hyphomonadaceae bacterium]|nr:hypothetical protein [Hyphomonadaceae bacterium]